MASPESKPLTTQEGMASPATTEALSSQLDATQEETASPSEVVFLWKRKMVEINHLTYLLPPATVNESEAGQLLYDLETDGIQVAVPTIVRLWGLDSRLTDNLTMHGITTTAQIARLTGDDVNEVCDSVGVRIGLRDLITFLNRTFYEEETKTSNAPMERMQPGPQNLQQFLQLSVEGKSLLAKRNLELTLRDRRLLVKLIILAAVDNSIPLENRFFKLMSEKIKSLFVRESKETYFTPGGELNKKKYRAGGLFITRKPIVLKTLNIDVAVDEENEPPEESHENPVEEFDPDIEQQAQKWLVNGRSPEEMVFRQWNDCFNIRKELFLSTISMTELTNAYPILNTSLGGHLLLKDFERRFPGKLQRFYEKFPLLHEELREHIAALPNDEYTGTLRDRYNSAEQGKEKDVLLVCLLPLLSPTNFRPSKNWRPSSCESIDGLVLQIAHVAEIADKMDTRKRYVTAKTKGKQRLQPTIVLVGKDACFVAYEFVRYPADDIIQAIAIAMATIFTLNLSYNVDCASVWHFIEHYMFDIKVSIPKKSAALLMKKLQR